MALLSWDFKVFVRKSDIFIRWTMLLNEVAFCEVTTLRLVTKFRKKPSEITAITSIINTSFLGFSSFFYLPNFLESSKWRITLHLAVEGMNQMMIDKSWRTVQSKTKLGIHEKYLNQRVFLNKIIWRVHVRMHHTVWKITQNVLFEYINFAIFHYFLSY